MAFTGVVRIKLYFGEDLTSLKSRHIHGGDFSAVKSRNCMLPSLWRKRL